ncbi:MAG: nucleotidyltransferase substrate binding protein [Parcubacteria group bacterium Gr01-1014_30]|nr:MAG: nucleotidyltransferase substrate binding protein [Parcubacteria group bacterium Gr01-1014_30]
MKELDAIAKKYKKAAARLKEVLAKPKTAERRDSAIKRFEITFDLAWKLTKEFLLKQKGVRCDSPKDCFREAYRASLIKYDKYWLVMIDIRNQAVHTYSEKFADSLYKKLPDILKKFKELEQNLT